MRTTTVNRRYAKALYDEAARQNREERVTEDVAFLRETLDEHRDLLRVFRSPIVSSKKKLAVIDALLEDRVSPMTLRFLAMLVRKDREREIDAVLRAYQGQVDEEAGIVEVQVRAARPLDAEAEQNLARHLEEMVGAKVRLDLALDSNLIGGLIVRVGDTVYNGSVRHQLAKLRERLKRGASVNGASSS